ncbi:MAG: DNA alkylation repair protein [Roseivirga sp.]|nr:DNA alkylation repair protein [Roseivirga sp.]
MKTITSKASLSPVISQLSHYSGNGNVNDFWKTLNTDILQHKVKFPILEHVAMEINRMLDREQENHLLDQIAKTKHMSGYPVIGKLIQLRLDEGLKTQYDLAIEHIVQGNEWYVCDIISERVLGEGTLEDFDTSLNLMKDMGNHGNLWIERSIGIATHYATKKKLPKEQVEQLLLLMIEHAWKTQYFTKKGIGWAGKTIGKYHPDLIHKHVDLMRSTKLSRWFISKVNIGLSMAKAEPFLYE